MSYNTLFKNQGQAYSFGDAGTNQPDEVWYVMQRPYKGGGEITQWTEWLFYMGATTYDVYTVVKDVDGIVPDSYNSAVDEPNANLQTDLKATDGFCYWLKISPTEADDIRGGWV